MICCKECLDLLCDYLEDNLDPQTRASLEEHFEDCPPCISFLNTYKTTTHICRATLSKTDIPDIVKIKLQEFLRENIKKI
ncbi:MAG: anti-sigma factor family protein [Nitrospinaceae bacterium]